MVHGALGQWLLTAMSRQRTMLLTSGLGVLAPLGCLVVAWNLLAVQWPGPAILVRHANSDDGATTSVRTGA
jgi:hypothetical protein